MRSTKRLIGQRCAARSTAFTLVELLVVVGVIAVLIAFLTPALAASRHRARAIQCQSNIHQLATGLLGYASACNGKFPPNVSSPSPGLFWYDDVRVGQYVPAPATVGIPDSTVYVCPEDETAKRSYAMNAWASSKLDQSVGKLQPGGSMWNMGTPRAAEMLLLAEAWSYGGSASSGYTAPAIVGVANTPGRRFGAAGGISPFTAGRWGILNCELTYARHRRTNGLGAGTQPRGQIAIAFGDSHVELLSSDEIVDYATGVLSGRCYWTPLDYP